LIQNMSDFDYGLKIKSQKISKVVFKSLNKYVKNDDFLKFDK